MKNNWGYINFKRYIKTVFLSVAICLLLLLTGCGSEETSAEQPQDHSTQAAVVQSESGKEQVATEAQKTEDAAGETDAKQDYAMIVEITINPKVALYLAKDGSVVDVEYLNEDAKNVFSNLEITGAKFEEAVSMIVDTSAKEGYLKEGKTISVDLVETAGEETAIAELTTNVQTAVQDTLTERQLSATLEIEVEGKVQESVALEPETADKQDASGQQEANQNTANKEDTGNSGNKGNTGSSAYTGNTGNSANADNQNTSKQEAPQPAKEPCSACGGTGICPECGGGTLPCKMCGGSLWENCGVCGGSGHQTCHGCHGSGKDATSGETCRHCGGSGGYNCEVCGGSGGKSCSICNGKGVVSDDCILCHGGKACTACGGTGTK